MHHRFPIVRTVAVAVGLLGLSGGPARADIYYTITVTGTITGGVDNGVFGGTGNLAGQAFTIEQIFDGTTATLARDTTYPYQVLLPVGGSAIVTVDDHTYTIETPVTADSGYFLAAGVALNGPGSGYYDEISGNLSGADTPGNPAYVRVNITSSIDDFVQSALFDQYLYFKASANDQTSVQFVTSLDNSGFSGAIDTVLIAVPEPSTALLLVGGIAACVSTRRMTRMQARRPQ